MNIDGSINNKKEKQIMPADSVSGMDPNNSSGNESQQESSVPPRDIRLRTESESSDKIARFVLPSMDGSPPQVLTLNEVQHVFKNIQNMELAHEIALNPEFKLEPYEPPVDSLERCIKDMLHKAFWDLLRTELEETPPCYDSAIKLLADIKECFPQILSPQNKRALEHINEVLDDTVIRQQAERGLLEFKTYADFVINIMEKSCAPARDEAVQKLREIDNVVDTFRGILETMSLMKLDMANYLLDYARNDILVHSVEYEKEKFKEYLEYYKFGFPATENWLNRNRSMDENNVPSNNETTIYNAYMELIDWPIGTEFPEVLSIDKERILKLGLRAKRLAIGAALMSLASVLPVISQRTENRIALGKQIEILLQDIQHDTDLNEVLENIYEQMRNFINEKLAKENEAHMSETISTQLKQQVLQLANKDAPVRMLLWKRLQTYVRFGLRSKNGAPPPPPGFVDYKDELDAFVTALKRVIGYNHSVFGDYFLKILNNKRDTFDRVPNNQPTTDVPQ